MIRLSEVSERTDLLSCLAKFANYCANFARRESRRKLQIKPTVVEFFVCASRDNRGIKGLTESSQRKI